MKLLKSYKTFLVEAKIEKNKLLPTPNEQKIFFNKLILELTKENKFIQSSSRSVAEIKNNEIITNINNICKQFNLVQLNNKDINRVRTPVNSKGFKISKKYSPNDIFFKRLFSDRIELLNLLLKGDNFDKSHLAPSISDKYVDSSGIIYNNLSDAKLGDKGEIIKYSIQTTDIDGLYQNKRLGIDIGENRGDIDVTLTNMLNESETELRIEFIDAKNNEASYLFSNWDLNHVKFNKGYYKVNLNIIGEFGLEKTRHNFLTHIQQQESQNKFKYKIFYNHTYRFSGEPTSEEFLNQTIKIINDLFMTGYKAIETSLNKCDIGTKLDLFKEELTNEIINRIISSETIGILLHKIKLSSTVVYNYLLQKVYKSIILKDKHLDILLKIKKEDIEIYKELTKFGNKYTDRYVGTTDLDDMLD